MRSAGPSWSSSVPSQPTSCSPQSTGICVPAVHRSGTPAHTQPNPGEFHDFSAICTHQGCSVTDIRDGLIACPCHGSRFRITDGAPERRPAREPLGGRETRVEGISIRIS
ncbi:MULTISPECIES: Rieske (2Fe-2S) protein [Nocardia]|nr:MULTISPECIES: Rieske (2Fe-2S) protein [Nocardia]